MRSAAKAISEGGFNEDLKLGDTSSWISDKASRVFNNKMETFDEWLYKFSGSTITYPSSFTVHLITDIYNLEDSNDIYFILGKWTKQFLGRYINLGDAIGVQTAPDGFTTEMKGLREVTIDFTGANTAVDSSDRIKGTYIFVVGDPSGTNGGWSFPGCVVTSMNATFSESKVKTDRGIRPLYAEVTFNLQYVQRPSRKNLLNNLRQLSTSSTGD